MKTSGGERGQAMVEFALVLPLLLAVVTAIAEFGIAFSNYLALVDAARAGARVAAVSADATNPAADTEAAIRAAASDLNQTNLVVPPPQTTWSAGSPVTVTAKYPYKISIFGMAVYSGWLQSSTTERVE